MGLTFQRVLSVADVPVRDQVGWKTVPARIATDEGRVVFEMAEIEVPENWSETATNVLAQKYFRKAGVPQGKISSTFMYVEEDSVPEWLCRCTPYEGAELGSETSAHQVFHRLAGCWTWWGWKSGVFATEDDARVFYDETYLCLARQVAAPNSPQWFNTGLWWAYGIKGPASGQWVADPPNEAQQILSDLTTEVASIANLPRRLLGVMERWEPNVYQVDDSYPRPQVHACFIQPVEDDLVNPGGIMDLWVKEARIFKHGSGSGTNFSRVRGKNELLSGGGRSSGLLSFLRVGDRAAGAIKSGGTTRRAAKMVVLDADHPDVEEFIDWKAREETKVAAMVVGGSILREVAQTGETDDTTVAERVPGPILDRFAHGFEPPDYDLKMEGEAYGTVSGQNSNNSIRIPNRFMKALETEGTWELTARTTGEVTKRLVARDLWNQLNRASWACADPGVQFDDTINEWHTCPVGGRINASNPCSEYYFVDDSGCNLASLNLVKFLDGTGSSLDLPLFDHVARLWTVVLDISVTMASFPSAEIARNTYAYRTLGLGYANLGGLLMRSGIPYDSPRGRARAAAITALMTGVAYRTSAELAAKLEPFPRWSENAESMRRVLRNHARATGVTGGAYEDLSIEPYPAIKALDDPALSTAVDYVWREVSIAESFRNAQVTVIAPTGTIALLMDCDTTGIEPDFALVKRKALAGGGEMTLINRGVEAALVALGYSNGERRAILEDLKRNGGNVYACPYIKEVHRSVFDCASPPEGSDRCVSWLGHVLMAASAQPLVSGGISKTINMPNDATIADVAKAHWSAWECGLKSIAIYRDDCKLDQPLRGAAPTVKTAPSGALPLLVEPRPDLTAASVTSFQRPSGAAPGALPRGARERPPARRSGGITQEVQIGEHQLYLTMNPYPDGRLAEVFLVLAKEGSTLRAFGDWCAMMISIGLQHGVPVETYVRLLRHLRFEPAGSVAKHDRIKMVSSIADFVARELAITFLQDDEYGQVVPTTSVETGDRIVALDRRALGLASTGYTGDACPECGNATLKPAGACLTCDTCGTSTGCG